MIYPLFVVSASLDLLCMSQLHGIVVAVGQVSSRSGLSQSEALPLRKVSRFVPMSPWMIISKVRSKGQISFVIQPNWNRKASDWSIEVGIRPKQDITICGELPNTPIHDADYPMRKIIAALTAEDVWTFPAKLQCQRVGQDWDVWLSRAESVAKATTKARYYGATGKVKVFLGL
ncbi:MAG: hypothetical protein HONBIEJF_02604 [Fimbriimonadaceae bacterium]|nr:hypothetical protein [Fimbriimonadaceae bacterium]